MSDQEKQHKTPPTQIAVKSHLRYSGFFPSVYAQHVAIQPIREEVLLSFFEITLPLILSPTKEDLSRLESEGVPAECVAKVVVSKRVFLEIADLFGQTASRMQTEESSQQNTINEP